MPTPTVAYAFTWPRFSPAISSITSTRLGGEILHGTELPFDVLKPLIAETAAKAVDSGDPHRVQTGPAVRGDLPTLRRHEAALAHDPRLLRIYESLSQDIWETSKKTS